MEEEISSFHNISVDIDSLKTTSFRDLPTYDQNPFIQSILSMKTKNKTVQIGSRRNMSYNENGEFIGESVIHIKKKVDKEEFVKVFKDQISLIFELSKTAQKVLHYIIKNLGMNKDLVIFDKSKAKAHTGLASTVSMYAGLTELIQKNVIARSNIIHVYYINPSILFNGDRLTVIKEWERDNALGSSSLENKEDWPAIEQDNS